MLRFFKKFIWLVLFLVLLNIGISVWVLMHDLRTRFPNLDFSESRFGIASWYSKTDKNINEQTASGEKFNDRKMTCASWDYPFGQRLVVINAFNGKWVVCRVNDRGPGKRLGREIDLTKRAFKKIANLKMGLIYVTVIPTEGLKTKKRN